MTEQEIKTLLNKLLKDLFFKILRIQEKAVSKSVNDALSRTEMHMLETIENLQKPTLTTVAEELGVTKATASVSASRLAKKKYIEKTRSLRDKRMSYLKLTDKGKVCCEKHRQFHDMMIQSLLKDFKVQEYPEIIKSLQGLTEFFNSFEEN